MKHPQRGAALLLAMIIVALISTLATAMVWQQWRAIQVETAERARAQSSWVLLGAGDWARLILAEQKTSYDALGQPWALPLQEARLSTFLAADKDNTDDAPDAFLSGAIVDAQSRYNLLNLTFFASSDVKGLNEEIARLDVLLSSIGASGGTAQRIATYMRAAYSQNANAAAAAAAATAAAASNAAGTTGTSTGTSGTGGPAVAANPTYLQPHTIDQLAWFGVDDDTIARMRPYVTILPASTQVNLNTASREVLAAVTEAGPSAAQQLVVRRQNAPFENIAIDVPKLVPNMSSAGLGRLTLKSTYFEVRGRLRLGDKVLEEQSIVSRSATTGNPTVTTILRRRESLRDVAG